MHDTATGDQILAACGDLAERQFAPGAILLAEGAPGGSLCILIDGEVDILKRDRVLVSIRDRGAVFGEMATLLGGTCSATVRARTQVRVRWTQDGAALLRERPEIALSTARILAQRLHAATAYLADLKEQYEERSGHFGMMDSILEALMQNQSDTTLTHPAPSGDPRL